MVDLRRHCTARPDSPDLCIGAGFPQWLPERTHFGLVSRACSLLGTRRCSRALERRSWSPAHLQTACAVPDHPFFGTSRRRAPMASQKKTECRSEHRRSGGAVAGGATGASEGHRGWMQGGTGSSASAGTWSLLAAQPPGRNARPVERAQAEKTSAVCPAVPREWPIAIRSATHGARLARYMSGVFPVKAEQRSQLAAVTHVDGTARVQTVDRAMCPLLHHLLWAYAQHSGLPVLLNTSLNLAGEPIVNRAIEGYSTFRRSGIDVLVAGTTVVTKQAATSVAPILQKETG